MIRPQRINKFLMLFFILFSNTARCENFSDSQVDVLIKKFAPLVYMHPQESYFPSSIEWFLERTELRKGPPKASELILESPTVADLSHNYKNTEDYFLTLQNSRSKRERNAIRRGQPLIQGEVAAPCYANTVDTVDGLLIQYFFFYPYNGAFNVMGWLAALGFGTHEGDWEHVDVYLTRKDEHVALKQIYYAAHGSTFFGKYVDAEAVSSVESHPIVYSSYHGHASYPSVFSINSTFDRTGAGPQWKCWKNTVHIASGTEILPGSEWLLFRGRWGGNGDGPHFPQRRTQATEYHFLFSEPLTLTSRNREKTWKTKNFILHGRTSTRYKKFYWNITKAEAFDDEVKKGLDFSFSIHTQKGWKKLISSEHTFGPFRGTGTHLNLPFQQSQKISVIAIENTPSDETDTLLLNVYGITE